MKIIIVYATAGAGHKKAAEVIAGHIRASSSDPVACLDIIDRSSWLFRLMYCRGYDFLVNHCQWLWSALFALTDRRAATALFQRARSFLHYLNTKQFCRFLADIKPDIVISTHFLSSDIVSYMKSRGLLSCRLITVITDFGVHPFWINPGTDAYCCASEITRLSLISRGVSVRNAFVTGIPVDPGFSRPHDKDEICRRLGIGRDRPAVLVVTGSFGIGPIEEIVKQLHEEYTVLAVCARNRRLYSRLIDRAYSNTKVFGFVDFIDDLMAVSSVIITKPGGLTISELLSMDLMPVFISAIPGQETSNVAILASAGIGTGVSDLRLIRQRVAACIRDAEHIKASIQRFKQPNAASRIYDIVRTDGSGCPG